METRRPEEAIGQTGPAVTNCVGDRQRMEKDECYAPTYKTQQIRKLDQAFAAKVADIRNSLRTLAEVGLERPRKKAAESFALEQAALLSAEWAAA